MNQIAPLYYLKFTGSYTQLKAMGFTFQKLYAANYLQWAKPYKPYASVRIWKKGSEVTIDQLTGREGTFFHKLQQMVNEGVDKIQRSPSGRIQFAYHIDDYTQMYFGDEARAIVDKEKDAISAFYKAQEEAYPRNGRDANNIQTPSEDYIMNSLSIDEFDILMELFRKGLAVPTLREGAING